MSDSPFLDPNNPPKQDAPAGQGRGESGSFDYGNGVKATKGADGKWYYPWRAEGYQDLLGDNDVSSQQQITQFRNQNPGGAAEDDQSALQQMLGNAPMKGNTGAAPAINSNTNTNTGGGTDIQNQLLQQMMAQQQQAMTDTKARGDNLYNMLMGRAQQGTTIDKNDPNIRQQADAYSANTERSKRNYLADVAERSGPYANLRGETRMANEHAGQANGGFEASLIGNELNARRTEIQNALSQMGNQLSVEQQNALHQQLGILDNAIQQQGVGNNLLGTLLQNQQFNTNQNNQNDQFAAQLGFNTANQASYWDAVRGGLLS